VIFVGSVGKVYKIDLSGKVLGTFGKLGRLPGWFDSIHAIACPERKRVRRQRVQLSVRQGGSGRGRAVQQIACRSGTPSIAASDRRRRLATGRASCGSTVTFGASDVY